MTEIFSKATTLISSATSREDLFLVGILTMPLAEAHHQMAIRMKNIMDTDNIKNIPTRTPNTMN